MRVVIDTCVWVAAMRSRDGASFALLSEIHHQRFKFGISVSLFLEYKTQLLKKGLLNKAHIDQILAAIAYYGVEVPIYYRLRPNLVDENDNLVFECAVHFGASAIITHNVKDFINPGLKGYNIDILRPRDFLLKIKEGNQQ